VDRIEDRFHVRHEELYTYASRGQEVVFVNARVAAVGEVERLDSDARPASSSAVCAPSSRRQAYFGGWREVPVYALDDLQPGHTLTGPAIIEAETTTVLVDTGDHVTVNALGWLDIALR
jgi:N-methylhydantoinase A